jgi:hypothetical protein
LAGVLLWAQLEPVLWAEISVSVGDTERLGYPAACSTKKIALSVPTLFGYGSVTFASAYAPLLDTESVPLWKFFAVAKVEVSKELEELLGAKCTW